MVHGEWKTSIGRSAIPRNGLRFVLRDASAIRIHPAQITHTGRIAGIGRFAIPRNGLRFVLRYAFAIRIHYAQVIHRRRLAGLDGFPVPGLGRTVVLRNTRSEEHTSELQSLRHLVCRLLLEKKKTNTHYT